MDFLRPRLARRLLAVTTIGVAFAGFGGACAAQDASGATTQAAYHGPYLSWSGKKAAAPAPDPDLAEARYAPAPDYAPGGGAPQPSRYAVATDASESRYGSPESDPAPAPRAAPPSAQAYARPVAYAPPAPQAAPAPQPAPPVQAAPAPQPSAGYAAPAAAAPPAEQAAGTRSVRFYSLHREYGMAPDPIPESREAHTVLIGPPDNGPAAHDKDQDADQDQDGADDSKPAAHGDASGGGKSGDN